MRGPAFLSAPLRCVCTTAVQIYSLVLLSSSFLLHKSPPASSWSSPPPPPFSPPKSNTSSSGSPRPTPNLLLTPSSASHSVTKCASVSSPAPQIGHSQLHPQSDASTRASECLIYTCPVVNATTNVTTRHGHLRTTWQKRSIDYRTRAVFKGTPELNQSNKEKLTEEHTKY